MKCGISRFVRIIIGRLIILFFPLQEKFKNYFAQKENGFDLNLVIKRRRDFKNPSMYEKLIEKFDVDEIGSNFNRTVFDPHGFTKDCFYDFIGMFQKKD